jgi:hypothetical protein
MVAELLRHETRAHYPDPQIRTSMAISKINLMTALRRTDHARKIALQDHSVTLSERLSQRRAIGPCSEKRASDEQCSAGRRS